MDLSDLRQEYTQSQLDEKNVAPDPFTQFTAWFVDYQKSQPPEANVVNLATVDEHGMPWQRTLLLKSFSEQGFVFFSHYDSEKGRHLAVNPQAGLHFLWLSKERQVHIQGTVKQLDEAQSSAYFQTRPLASKLGAWASKQSRVIASRAVLEAQLAEVKQRFQGQEISKPDTWGGYVLEPSRFEFWQGGAGRLHDRVQYQLQQGIWCVQRLSP